MLPPVHLLSARGREIILAGTLQRWAATDWPGLPRVHLDPAPGGDPAVRIPTAWRSMLQRALATYPDVPQHLFLEDDLGFSQRLAHHLRAWTAAPGITTFGSLFLPARIVPHGVPGAGADTLLLPPERVLGAQALLLSAPFARILLQQWPEPGGVTSARIASLAAQVEPGGLIPYRTPSLIEHLAVASSWAGRIHQAERWEEA